MVDPKLFPAWEIPQSVADALAAQPTAPFGVGPLFDFDVGDLVVDGTGISVLADGYATWAQWCLKAFLTQRGAYPIYDIEFGVDWEGVLALDTPALLRGALEREITRALRDPRTAAVKDFAYSQVGDALTVSLTAVPTAGAPLELERTVQLG